MWIWRVGLIVLALLTWIGVSAAEEDGSDLSDLASPQFVGVDPCPHPTKEFAFITYARDDTSPAVCATIVSCTNFDKVTRTVMAQFFDGFSNEQVGGEAPLPLSPGVTAEFATRSADPLGIRSINSSVATGEFEGKGRICTDAKKLVCMATLSCSSPAPLLQTLNMILKGKQLGD